MAKKEKTFSEEKFEKQLSEWYKKMHATSKRFYDLCIDVMLKGGTVEINTSEKGIEVIEVCLDKPDYHKFSATCETSAITTELVSALRHYIEFHKADLEKKRRERELENENAKLRAYLISIGKNV